MERRFAVYVWPSRRILVFEVINMIGQLALVREKGRFQLEETALGPLRVLRAVVYEPDGLALWRLWRRLRKAERALVRADVDRVILGADFPYGDRLAQLRTVDLPPLWRGTADVLALGALDAEGVVRRRGRVALSAPRLCSELEGAAERLCPQVRALLIDAPGGLDYARYLQARFGLPVTPPAAGADVTAAFGPGGGRWGRCLELYPGGSLNGFALRLPELELPEDCAEQVLALLWERGEVSRGQLTVIKTGM